mmetsp:Transcript_19226/g.53609  ORF Transcript_19226/g.53609 Transcript_19226/m.53609 type:complete len:561 (-) Transcript_19226:851-2533(-)|eukprot:CAMPEP_0117690568 /NCGR_PEP_ID=MMETSP0804-20121206/25197_1 /TAXON_ID=1074897 /ORGANISM="Tetraselmis astigmatica, Strain CCMP880" /LENGTH=560 /DNA_ID=CAMNT_0005503625 /DNA_START=184 /DNA_END=1866 /DNA_ORIENTATION=+
MQFFGTRDRSFLSLAVACAGSAAATAACFHLMLRAVARSSTRPRRSCWWLRQALLLGRYAPGGVFLRGARIPVSLCPPELRESQDAEGLVAVDVKLLSGEIVDVKAASQLESCDGRISGGRFDFLRVSISLGGAIVMTPFGDSHTHLVKTHTVPRVRNPTGSTNDAIRCQMDDAGRWSSTPGDVHRRVHFAVRTAWHHGCSALRTHLDGGTPDDPVLQSLVYDVFDQARATWLRKGLVLQGVANLYLPLYLKTPYADDHVQEASLHEGVVLGAYCGLYNLDTMPDNSEIEPAFDALFQYALEYNMDVDLHIDETNDSECCAMLPLCASLKRFREKGYTGQVVLGHVCSLALVEKATAEKVISSLQHLSPITVVCNPYANIALMDRRGTGPPIGLEIPAEIPRTPRWRGITLLQELRAAGVAVAAASDNVRDSWHTYGDYDCLSVLALAVGLGHLDTAPDFGTWSDLVTSLPKAAMGLPAPLIASGTPADLVIFPSARRASELLSRPQHDRVVVRRGKLQRSFLPDYAELDDLVSEPTKRLHLGTVTRGAASNAAPPEADK